ncbi:hypothetical protein EYF80_033264 [Liparis tanakae]|uniref:Uncharacterized protein n=1 Tax=Liparis tanakae TaxID=230148 RepID=A0A4Z2GSA0_9TELE|nr:hypothetical protein EYF80_033264 [Liparis tanakae]
MPSQSRSAIGLPISLSGPEGRGLLFLFQISNSGDDGYVWVVSPSSQMTGGYRVCILASSSFVLRTQTSCLQSNRSLLGTTLTTRKPKSYPVASRFDTRRQALQALQALEALEALEALDALASGGGGGQESGKVEAGALPDGAEDRRRRVGGDEAGRERVLGEADGRPQVALVGRHAAVDGRGGEEPGLGRRDEEGLRPRTPLGLFALVVLLPFGVPERAPAGDDDRGLVVAAAGVLMLRGPGGPVGGRGVLVPGVRRAAGFLRSHRHRHGDDERQQAVVSGPLGVQAPGFGGTPRPAGLLL